MYSFAVNPTKLELAITKAQDKSEKSVLEEYIKLGGAVKQNYVELISEISSVATEEQSVDEQVAELRVVRSARKSKATSK